MSKRQKKKERKLYRNMIDVEYDYYSYMSSIWQQQFLKETEGLILNTNHCLYESFFGKSKVEKSEKLTYIFHELCKKCHPDRIGNTPENNEQFIQIKEFFDTGNLDELIKIADQHEINNTEIEINNEISNFMDIKEKEKAIFKIKHSFYYQYLHADPIYRELLIKPENI